MGSIATSRRPRAFQGLALVLPMLLAACGFSDPGLALGARPQIPMVVGHKSFRLWSACSPAEQRLGLKQVGIATMQDSLAQPAPGMVFVYPGDRIALFSMKDMAVDLDLALIDSRGLLLHVETLSAASSQTFSWPEPIRYAIEAPAGSLRGAQLQIGTQVLDDSAVSNLRKLCASQ